MLLFCISFFSSTFLSLGLFRFRKLHQHLSGDHDLISPQKFHTNITPRIGGLAIYLALCVGAIAAFFKGINSAQLITFVLLCSLPVFIGGLVEDLTKKVSVKNRLLAGIFSGVLFLYLFKITSIRLDVWGLDVLLMNTWCAYLFLAIACSGLSNAYNIIDGFNGLASMTAIISTAAITFVAFTVNDTALVYLGLIILGAVTGFFIWNYPKGLIFLGDGGAYLIGFLIAALSILLVQRNLAVSPWFALLVNIYPIFETLFTIWRRTFHQGKNPGIPDGIHLHTLIYRRVIRWAILKSKDANLNYLANARTSPYLWAISCLGVVPAIIFWDNTLLLIPSTLAFIFFYTYIYRSFVKFNCSKWLTRSKDR